MAGLLEYRDKCQLGFRRDTGKHIRRQHPLAQFIADRVCLDASQLTALDHPQLSVAKTRMPGDRRRRIGVIAGQHDHPHTGRSAGPYGRGHILADRIQQADQPHQRQGGIGTGVILIAVFHRQPQQPEPLAGGLRTAVKPFRARGRVEVARTIRGQHRFRTVDHRFRCALDRDKEASVLSMYGGHQLAVRIEGMLANFGVVLRKPSVAHPRGRRNRKQRQLHRIARTAVCLSVAKLGIVAQRPDPDRPGKGSVVGR